MQCGYCTPRHDHGRRRPARSRTPTRRAQEIVRAMDGNICRCGTYPRIVAAIRKAAEAMKGGAPMNERHRANSTTDSSSSPSATSFCEDPALPLRPRPPRVLPRSLGGGIVVLCLLREATRAGPGARRRAPAAAGGGGPPPGDRRLAAHRRGRHGHRLHRQGRGRPEHPDLADAGRGRGAARPARRRSAWSWATPS